jgi:carbonic anhydrase/acetyltransferase-like protein (isoleucine patch superfamily)
MKKTSKKIVAKSTKSNAKQKKPVSTKKYELTEETIKTGSGKVLHRIRALKDFVCQGFQVHKGDLGGFLESEKNLDQEGNCWVSGYARVYGDASVFGKALVSGHAWVYGDAWVSGNAWVYGDAWVSGNAWVSGDAWVYGDARVSGNAWVYGKASVFGDAWVYGDAKVYGNAWVSEGELEN